jgi:aminoglycoside phosphotransferase (APT) family kinase protein
MPDRQRLAEYLSIIGEPPGGRAAAARLARGQFHDVVLVGDVAYRFPRDEESRARLPARVALLTVLAHRRLPVAVPGLLSQAALHEPLGRCHVVLRRVTGQPLGREAVTGTREQAAVARDLAALLDRLARLGGDAGIRAVVPGADRQLWHRFAADVSTVLFPLMPDHGRKRAEAELSRVLSVDPVGGALVHGDLGGTNLLWHTAPRQSGPRQTGPPEPGHLEPGDAAGRHGGPAAGPGRASAALPRLAGVLDWDEARIGSQADDLASIAATFGWPLARRVDARRHAGQTPTIAAAEAIAGTFALQQALPAALSGDAASLADGLTRYRTGRQR